MQPLSYKASSRKAEILSIVKPCPQLVLRLSEAAYQILPQSIGPDF